ARTRHRRRRTRGHPDLRGGGARGGCLAELAPPTSSIPSPARRSAARSRGAHGAARRRRGLRAAGARRCACSSLALSSAAANPRQRQIQGGGGGGHGNSGRRGSSSPVELACGANRGRGRGAPPRTRLLLPRQGCSRLWLEAAGEERRRAPGGLVPGGARGGDAARGGGRAAACRIQCSTLLRLHAWRPSGGARVGGGASRSDLEEEILPARPRGGACSGGPGPVLFSSRGRRRNRCGEGTRAGTSAEELARPFLCSRGAALLRGTAACGNGGG
ncbi:unnamed protein product, partial [Urochloa humidicola]